MQWNDATFTSDSSSVLVPLESP